MTTTSKNENVNFNDYKYLGYYDNISTEKLSTQLDSIINNAKETINKVKEYANSVGLLYKDTGSTNDFLAVMDREDTRDIVKKYIDTYENRQLVFLLRDIAEYYGLKDDYYANSNYYILREKIKQITKDLGYKGITWNYI